MPRRRSWFARDVVVTVAEDTVTRGCALEEFVLARKDSDWREIERDAEGRANCLYVAARGDAQNPAPRRRMSVVEAAVGRARGAQRPNRTCLRISPVEPTEERAVGVFFDIGLNDSGRKEVARDRRIRTELADINRAGKRTTHHCSMHLVAMDVVALCVATKVKIDLDRPGAALGNAEGKETRATSLPAHVFKAIQCIEIDRRHIGRHIDRERGQEIANHLGLRDTVLDHNGSSERHEKKTDDQQGTRHVRSQFVKREYITSAHEPPIRSIPKAAREQKESFVFYSSILTDIFCLHSSPRYVSKRALRPRNVGLVS